MTTKKSIRTLALAAVAMMAMSACQDANKMDNAPAAAPAQGTTTLKIAYVEVDSIMTQYNFCKEYQKILAPQKTKETSSLIKLDKKPIGNISQTDKHIPQPSSKPLFMLA